MRSLHKCSAETAGKAPLETDMVQYRKMCEAAMADVPIATHVHDKKILPASKIPIKEITSVIETCVLILVQTVTKPCSQIGIH